MRSSNNGCDRVTYRLKIDTKYCYSTSVLRFPYFFINHQFNKILILGFFKCNIIKDHIF